MRRVYLNRVKAAKFIGCETLLFLMLIGAETTVFAHWRPFSAVPDLCYVTVLLIAYFCGKEAGAVTGIAVGFAVDAVGSVGLSLMPVFYFLTAYACGYFTSRMQKSFPLFLSVGAVSVVIRSAMTFLTVMLTYHEIRFGEIFLKILLPEAGATFLFVPLLYYPMKKLCGWMSK